MLTRRQFLHSAAAATSVLALPRSLRTLLARIEEQRLPARGALADIEHVVMLMQENRSFDHYFGTLAGVRGFDDPQAMKLPNGRSVFYQPDAENPDGYELPFHLPAAQTSADCVADLAHTWSAEQASWNGGRMDNWIAAHRYADGAKGPLTMGYFTRSDLPFHYALADAFTVCDAYFCSMRGPTDPNRLYAWTGTIDPAGRDGGPVISNAESRAYTWTTYPERLERAGISWRVYQEIENFDCNPLAWFKQYQRAPTGGALYENGMKRRDRYAFEGDVASGNLPQVSWIVTPAAYSEHPSYLPAMGATYIYNILQALALNPKIWATTVLFLTCDENDGYFDHVAPPTPPPGTEGEYISAPLPKSADGIAGPIGLGFRVPMIVISPWSVGGRVSSEVFDHTSMLRFLEARFGVPEPNISAWRRKTCGDLTSTLRLIKQAASKTFPALRPPERELAKQEVACHRQPAPQVPLDQRLPHQEAGQRRRLPVHMVAD